MAVSLDYAQPDGKAVSRLFSTYGKKRLMLKPRTKKISFIINNDVQVLCPAKYFIGASNFGPFNFSFCLESLCRDFWFCYRSGTRLGLVLHAYNLIVRMENVICERWISWFETRKAFPAVQLTFYNAFYSECDDRDQRLPNFNVFFLTPFECTHWKRCRIWNRNRFADNPLELNESFAIGLF